MSVKHSNTAALPGLSKAQLLERLKSGNITLGWGAVVAFNRRRINQILQKQYLANFTELRFLLPFNRSFFTDTDKTEEIQLKELILGEPSLSFETAMLGNSEATLTMNIISGSYTSIAHAPAKPSMVRESFKIREDMGYRVRMSVELVAVQDTVGERGRVSLDLSKGHNVTCNLGATDYSSNTIGEQLKVYLQEHPAYRKIFVLGGVDYNDYGPLAPRSFALRTQAAPGAADPQALNHGDGALVVFIQLTSNPERGTLPVNDEDFVYLIPNDTENEQPSYSAAVVVEKRLIPLADPSNLAVIKHILFPGGYTIACDDSPDTPHDLVVFGKVSLAPGAKVVEPAIVMVKAGQPEPFTVISGTDVASAPDRWSASNLDRPLSVGQMEADGTYRPQEASSMRREQQVSVITAHYSDAHGDLGYSALAVEYAQSLAISPLIYTWGEGMEPVKLKASSLKGNSLDWKLVGDVRGTLEVLDNHNALFSPDPQKGQPVWIQTIEVTDSVSGEVTRAAVIIFVAAQSLQVLPHYVPTVTAGNPVRFEIKDLDDPAKSKWAVYGEGSISAEGLFTPPDSPMTPVCVVLGEISESHWGYAIVELSGRQLNPQAQRDLHWIELAEFAIEGLDGAQCYTNGMQQIPLRVKIKTKPVCPDPENQNECYDIPLSDVELSSLELVREVTNAEVPFIEAGQEGLEGTEIPWAVNVLRNRFKLYSATTVNEYEQDPPPLADGLTKYRELFMHCAEQGSVVFYAQFTDAYGQVRRSTDLEWPNNKITLKGIPPPTPDRGLGGEGHYDFIRERVFNGQGEEKPDDPFSYLLDSIDYWTFGYRRNGIYATRWSTLKVLGNASTLQYESEQLEETFASFTGYGFYPQPAGRTDAPPVSLVFDAYLTALWEALSYNEPSSSFEELYKPGPGELIVSMHRVADLPYWHDSMAPELLIGFRERLDGPVRFELRDEEGNLHRFDVGFEVSTREDSRNQLIVNFQ